MAVACRGGAAAPPVVANRSAPPADAAPGAPGAVVPGQAVGAVRLGMREAEVRAALGAPDTASADFLDYYRLGLEIGLADGVVTAIHVFRGVPGGYNDEPWQPYAFVLAPGIRWGITEAALVATRGPPSAAGELAGAPIPSRWLSYADGVMFDFRIDDGRLFHVAVFAPDPAP